MANRSDLELALRLKADLQQGQQALQALEQNVRDVGNASDVASTKLQGASQAADQLGSESQAAAAAAKKLGAGARESAGLPGVEMDARSRELFEHTFGHSPEALAALHADAVEPKKPEGMSEQDFHNMRHVFGDDVFAQAQKD